MGEGRERGEGRREEMRKGREGVGSEQRGKREGVCQQQGLQSAVIFMPSRCSLEARWGCCHSACCTEPPGQCTSRWRVGQ